MSGFKVKPVNMLNHLTSLMETDLCIAIGPTIRLSTVLESVFPWMSLAERTSALSE